MPPVLGQVLVGLAVALVIWLLADVVLLLFFAVLLACVLRGASEWVAGRTGLPAGPALAAVVLVLIGMFAAAAYWIAPELVREGYDLASRLAQEWSALQKQIGQTPTTWGSGGGLIRLQGLPGRLADPVETVLGSTLSVVAGALVVVVTAIYLAASPELYVRGVLHLIPLPRRPRAQDLMARAGRSLQLWFVGQLVDMATVGVLAGGGLLLAGVPVPFALGVLSALLTFIPYFGAIMAAVPALLVALTIGWPTALWALAIYTVCHCIEGYVVAPLVQRRLVELPPALTVIAMTIAGALFGVLGLAMGTPLAAVAMVAVRMLYVEDALGDRSVGDERIAGL